MIEAKENNYVYGTVAEEIQYDVYKENKVLREKRKQKTYNKAKFKVVCMVLFVFALCIVLICRYALITELNYKIDKQVKQYNEIKNENIRLRVDMQNKLDINKVKEIAETKLGMQKPDKYQIVYVKVPKTDSTKVADGDNIDGKEKVGLNVLLDKVGKFTKLLY